ncbi:hypothetical protein FQN05_03505 [Corynebacterium aurimucosum]|uniref:Secreted protein n=1 Tax=Corynebacterium aurimucosum TaxID=169292 RepID=A0A558IWN6_9CORY|nr:MULTISPECIES: hypothetical protein [Corynebacterium]OFK67955.1 hypothetical protein HMPREF2806_07930 [Corynebacterium sp. HMSC076G08]OFK70232.1 hypothetical protein HMPREF2807_00190 [Corynebacterium sp. HMSC074A09]OHO55417.1 hypothetical protein HMPREF2635_05300 [Corynebacterium sp. HMSC035E02]TVU85773.1 hypothetical protein FQN05_03505 [Corynebacterium aurimucosum]
MNNFSRGLLAATLTGSLVFAGTTVASAEEAATTTNCGTPKAEFTVKIDGKDHTFKKVSEFAWQATDNAELTLSRFDVFQMAKEGAAVCDSESIDLGDWGASQGGPGKVDFDIVDGERQDPAPVEDEDKDKDKNEQDKDKNKDKKSSVKDELSSEDNKPTPLGIAAIVAGVLAVIAAAFPFVKNALKL